MLLIKDNRERTDESVRSFFAPFITKENICKVSILTHEASFLVLELQ